MEKNFERIKTKIETEFIGANFDGITDTEEILTEIYGSSVSWHDSKIDDGVDDDETEDCYVMCDLFSSDDDKLDVRIYYGDVSREIGYVSVQFNEPPRKESFNCVVLSRADFEDRGFDTSNISNEQMERIASKIGETLVENLYWECIDVWGESEKMPKLKN